MARLRRFCVNSLESKTTGQKVEFPAEEAKHIRVLRLEIGDEIELFDNAGRSAKAKLSSVADQVSAELVTINESLRQRTGLVLAVAWPKGKRAATLVEKCSELGVTKIIPVAFERSVVSKDDESEGIARLRRIAAEAAKQSGRNDVPEITSEIKFEELVKADAQLAIALLLEPRATCGIVEVLEKHKNASKAILLIVGPEGGFADEELKLADESGIQRVKISGNILRVETAALAACAIAGAALI